MVDSSMGNRDHSGMKLSMLRELGLTWERIRAQGLRETVAVVPEYAIHLYRDLRDGFDREHGTDTMTRAALADVDAGGTNVNHGKVYWPVSRPSFRESLRALPMQHAEYVFIDLGSGKGRALLLASEFSFRRVVGVEFARGLHEIAERNIEHFVRSKREPKEQRKRFELLCMDAAEYGFPSEPLVVFMFYPFDRDVLVEVISNLHRSIKEVDRPVYVVYHHALNDDVLTDQGLFSLVAEKPEEKWRFGWRVYSHTPQGVRNDV